LEEILEWLRFLNPTKFRNLHEGVARQWWLPEDSSELPTQEDVVFSQIANPLAVEPAHGFVTRANACRDEDGNFFALGMSFCRVLMFLGPAGLATLSNMKELFSISPYGRNVLDSHTNKLLCGGYWTATEMYASELENHLKSLDATVKTLAKNAAGWACQPSLPMFANQGPNGLGRVIAKVTEQKHKIKQQKQQEQQRLQHQGDRSNTQVDAPPTGPRKIAVPPSDELLTRSRVPLSSHAPTFFPSCPPEDSEGTPLNLKDSACWSSQQREQGMQMLAQSRRKLAATYDNDDGVSGLPLDMLDAVVHNEGDNRRYMAESKAPAAGAKKHFYVKVSQKAREIDVDVTEKDFDNIIQRQYHLVNFNKFEEVSLGTEFINNPKMKDMVPPEGWHSLREQFVKFEAILAVVVGQAEAVAEVGFWVRELTNMRNSQNVDWNSAYTVWRNWLADYATRWREWKPTASAPPNMWDWEKKTAKLYKKVLQRGSVDLIDDLVLAWKKPPVIVRELANSQLLKALGSDSSATVRMTAVLRSLTTSAADLSLDSNYSDGTKLTKNAKKKKKATAERKRKLGDSSDDDSEDQPTPNKPKTSFTFSGFGDGTGAGKACTNMQTHKVWDSDTDCPVYAKFKCCNYFHPKAPSGTTGSWAQLNVASQQILADGGRGPADYFGSVRLRREAEARVGNGSCTGGPTTDPGAPVRSAQQDPRVTLHTNRVALTTPAPTVTTAPEPRPTRSGAPSSRALARPLPVRARRARPTDGSSTYAGPPPCPVLMDCDKPTATRQVSRDYGNHIVGITKTATSRDYGNHIVGITETDTRQESRITETT
jgi:hypothetical protein